MNFVLALLKKKTIKCTIYEYSCVLTTVPNIFGTRDWFCGRQVFHGLGRGMGDSFWMTQVHFIYCAL